jgi:hypothetical protein
MGGILKALLPIAAVAAAPLTGGTSLAGLGAFVGSAAKVLGAVSSAQSLFGGGQKEKKQEEPQAAQAPAYTPSRPDEAQRPESLSEFGTFTPEQQRSALATKGLNSGLGSDEESYYRNLVQRSLIGDGNTVQQDNPNFLLPVESQYFSRQGHDTSNIMKFLEGISG